MKTAFTTFLFFICSISFGQLTVFQPNTSLYQIKNSLVLKEFGDGYSQTISFSSSSNWSIKYKLFFVLKYNKEWTFTRLKVHLSKKGKTRSSKKNKLPLEEGKLSELLSFMSQNNFWALQQDSLNLNKMNLGDGRSKTINILDGSTDEFLFKNGKNIRIYSAHNPERLQEFVATEQRGIFLKAKDMFYRLISYKQS